MEPSFSNQVVMWILSKIVRKLRRIIFKWLEDALDAPSSDADVDSKDDVEDVALVDR